VSAQRAQWTWLAGSVVHAIHEVQLAEHGGPGGIRDANLLASALARPQQPASYETPDAAALAASYGFGIARDHPFNDGNKRSAFVAIELFLALNGHELSASDADCVFQMLDLAAGKLDEQTFADWIRRHLESA
jgi:death-on-curing protein